MLKVQLFRSEKKVLASLLSLIILLNISSCTKAEIDDSGNNPQEPAEIAAIFRTTTTTRASGTTWDVGDAIGIFAVNQDEDPDALTIYNNKENIKYVNNTAGSIANFLAANEEIKFPTTKEMLNFIAYYPYTSTAISKVMQEETGAEFVIDFNLAINVAEQSQQSEIDILHATATGYNSDNPEVVLSFHHALTQLIFLVTAEEEINLEGAEITIHNAVTQGTISLKNATVIPTTEAITRNAITPTTTYNTTENSITSTAIMLPGWDLSETEVYIQTANGNIYLWQPEEYQLQPNTSKTYRLNLTSNTVNMQIIGSTISEWQIDPYDAIEDITPVDKVANGTEDSPYTVSQFKTKTNEAEIWVEGYIMGWATRGSDVELKTESPDEFYAKENIVIADDITEADFSKMLPIKFIRDSDAQAQLNLFDNLHLIGTKVKVCCSTGEVYGIEGATDLINFEIM